MRQTIIESTETGLYGYEQYANRETWVTIFTVTVNKVIFFFMRNTKHRKTSVILLILKQLRFNLILRTLSAF